MENICFCIIIIIMFDFVCDRLGSPSDLVKSWGGGGCDGRKRSTSAGIGLMDHSVILYMLSGPRALLIALCLRIQRAGSLGINTAVGDSMHIVTLVLTCRGTMLYIVCVLQA